MVEESMIVDTTYIDDFTRVLKVWDETIESPLDTIAGQAPIGIFLWGTDSVHQDGSVLEHSLGSYKESIWNARGFDAEDYLWDRHVEQRPSIVTELNRKCAFWAGVIRANYADSYRFAPSHMSISDQQIVGIVYLTKDDACHSLDSKICTNRVRDWARGRVEGLFGEYILYLEGENYGIVIETFVQDEDGAEEVYLTATDEHVTGDWEEYDTAWGLIGDEYANVVYVEMQDIAYRIETRAA